MTAFRRVLDPSRSANRLLRALLALMAVVVAVASDIEHLVFVYPFGVDLEIPLRAAERWRTGGEPYLASAFVAPPGATQPFLYPPYVLPPLSLLVDLPRTLVLVAWCVVCLASAAFICRRLGFPIWTWPFVLLWPPMLEPLIGGNVQVPVVALFCLIFWVDRRDDAFAPRERDLTDPRDTGAAIGIAAAASAAMKVSQPHAFIAVLRRRPAIALIGAAAVAAVGLLALPFTGVGLWADWLSQLRRATDPTWELGGIAIARLTNPQIGLGVGLFSIIAVFALLPRRHAGAWVGVLGVVGATSLHLFGTLFLIPAMLLIRRELALIAAMLIATTTYEGTWAGIIVVAATMMLSLRWPIVVEPAISGRDGTTQSRRSEASSTAASP